MKDYLSNPVWNALLSGNADKAEGSDVVRYFNEEVSPFAGFDTNFTEGFNELHEYLPAGRKILYATRTEIRPQSKWAELAHVSGSQFVFRSEKLFHDDFSDLIKLDASHAESMISLAKLTKPGPFDKRTIEFGNYNGIFENDTLVAMTGRRLHVHNFMEVSAVCTHPDFLGKGYAGLLLKHQVNSIINESMLPFLHVRADNKRAIDLYERLGFIYNGPMHFYFMRNL